MSGWIKKTLRSREIYNHVGIQSIDEFAIQNFGCNFKHLKFQKFYEEKESFYKKLEQSILSEGIRNPILVHHGCTHTVLKKLIPLKVLNSKAPFICDNFGGSRLYIAQKHDLYVPCIIVDLIGNMKQGKKLYTVKDIKNEFDIDIDVYHNIHGLKIVNKEVENE